MAEQGYLLSQSAINKLKSTTDLVRNFHPQQNRRVGNPHPARYFAEITGKDTGTPQSASYTATQVICDTSGYFITLSGGLTWSDSGDLGSLYDLQSMSDVCDNVLDDDLYRVPLGSIVEVFNYGDENGNTIWYFNGPEIESFWARLTDDGTPYSWERLRDDASTTATLTGTSNATEVNGRTGIPSGSIVRMWGDTQNSGSLDNYYFEFHGADVTGGSPFDITYTGEHQETARTSPAVNWDRTNQGSYRGVKLTVITGVAYYDAGDEILYCYAQDLTFDCNGHLVLISEETRVEVDVPDEDCTP